jgi:putative endonuclease
MSQHNQKIGRWGEEIAAVYLEKKGYDLINRNVRTPYGEIDLIARQRGRVIFVEVKTTYARLRRTLCSRAEY